MNEDMARRIWAMRPLSGFLEGCDLSTQAKDCLVRATSNRAILLCEISDFVIRNVLRFQGEEIRQIEALQQRVSNACEADRDVPGRHLPNVVVKHENQSLQQAYLEATPRHWTALDMAASGLDTQVYHLGQVLREMYDERGVRQRWESHFPQHTFTSFAQRCSASGCEDLIPSAVIDPSNQLRERHNRGTIQQRLKKRFRTSQTTRDAPPFAEHWRFVSHLEAQGAIFVSLNTVQGSWTSLESEWSSFSMYMSEHHRGRRHFPVTVPILSSFVAYLDNASSAKKYLQALGKASHTLGHAMPHFEQTKLVKAGSNKFYQKKETSFQGGDHVDIFARECVVRQLMELASFIPVAYTFQLRVQSEGIMLGTSSMTSSTWHSHVWINQDGSVTIRLRVRKNKSEPSRIVRHCICEIWRPKIVCGVCALKKRLQRHDGYGRLFPNIKASDIKVLKDISSQRELGHVTWHGFRRGRTEDVVAGLDVKQNPAASIQEVAESLGHNLARSSFFAYIKGSTAQRRQIVRQICEDTESE